MKQLTLGSLFDGAGGFPFAGQICGVKPLWASEIEPFPIAVTSKRFPEMKHLGDITKINGAEVEPVDILTFGSPCQDLSVAGRQQGLSGERSGLFMEAIRIIKEMRAKTNGIYPTIAIWENVPGAFSSNKGEDFRTVLEEFCKIKDSNAVIPRPPKGKWADAGEIVGDGFSIAWRVLDAQFHGVPQRRRRIFLVGSFRGERAGEILFKRDGLSRNFAESRESWQGITKSLAFRPDAQGQPTYCLQGNGIDRADTAGCNGRGWRENQCYTLNTIDRPAVCCFKKKGHPRNSNEGQGWTEADVNDTLNVFDNSETRTPTLVFAVGNGQKDNTGLHEIPGALNCMHDQQAVLCIRERCGCAGGGQGANAQFNPGFDEDGKAFTVIAKGPGGVCYVIDMGGGKSSCIIGDNLSPKLTCSHGGAPAVCINPDDIILRRLTPTECARLQGMPDWWCDDVPHSDSAEYKMWGNGMALPCVLYVMEGVVEALSNKEEDQCPTE